jgi:hypothetical protein
MWINKSVIFSLPGYLAERISSEDRHAWIAETPAWIAGPGVPGLPGDGAWIDDETRAEKISVCNGTGIEDRAQKAPTAMPSVSSGAGRRFSYVPAQAALVL